MCGAGLTLLVIGALAGRSNFGEATGLGKIVALSNLCFAIPLAVFGAEHLSGAPFLKDAVPPYVPWHLFWAYFVGFALFAASLSIATKIQVLWSGLLFGLMMFLFVAMIHLPQALATHTRFSWAIVFREPSFAAGAWILSASAINGSHLRAKNALMLVGRVIIGVVAIFFGIEQLLHPLGMPGVPLEKEMPIWIPGRLPIGYVTGAALFAAGICILLAYKTRSAATYLGAWLLFLVLVIYGPVMVAATCRPEYGDQGGGHQLLCRHVAFHGIDSGARKRYDAF